jgi:hypothetical protein
MSNMKSKGIYQSHIKPMKNLYLKRGIMIGIWIGFIATLIGFLIGKYV